MTEKDAAKKLQDDVTDQVLGQQPDGDTADLDHDELIVQQMIDERPELVERLANSPKVQAVFAQVTQMRRSGPLPESSEFAAYEQVHAGAAERILKMSEREQTHRHGLQNREMELRAQELELRKTMVDGAVSRERRGQYLGFTIALFVLIFAVVMASTNHTGIAMALVAIDLVGLAAVFVLGRVLPSQGSSNDSPPDDE
ncbi:DUF2335 domain-containing protein [Pseudaeromonas paramecii]|uniref:DUF2335 domain-containing protein n=1 Tax=Pseudaeromonas paramecii TaxID=2138166 RepID=A0ABP8PV21_9GAMM